MSEGLGKIWRYLIPLGILAVVATCDTDFEMINPFSKSDESDTVPIVEEVDSVKAEMNSSQNSIKESELPATDIEPGPDDNSASNPGMTAGGNSEKKWRLVIGSVPDKQKAEALVAKSGNSNVQIMYVDELSTYRLVYGSYENIRDAQQALSEIRGSFPDAWMVFF